MGRSEDVAWAAGFFDGEGYIGIIRGHLRFSIPQIDPRPLRKFQSIFGGRIRLNKPVRGRESSRPCYYYGMESQLARVALREMMPYLTLKQDQARVALYFLKYKHSRKEQRERCERLLRDLKTRQVW